MTSGVLIVVYSLIQSFFKEKTGKMLTNEQFEKFIKDHTIDGKFILPDAEEIDVDKYIK